MGGFGWNYLPEETLDGDTRQECIAHGTLSFIEGEYAGKIYESVEEWRNGEAYGAHVFDWTDGNKNYEDEADAWGSAAFPKGAKITMKLIPDEGYQLISLYGDENVEPQDEVGVYTITMAGGMNSHLSATFIKVEDSVKINASLVNDGQINNLENIYNEGTMQLSIDNADIDENSRQGFDNIAQAEDGEIHDYMDISLDNIIYKASENADDSWNRNVSTLENPAQISLTLNDDYSDKELFIIHEHEGDYNIIPVNYDKENNSITFETDKFSNYALASKTPSQDEEEYKIKVNTDGNGTYEAPETVKAQDKGIVITLNPNDGYIFDSLSAKGIEEGEEGPRYSILYSAWPIVGIYINEMPANDIEFDVKFKKEDENISPTISSLDGNYSLQLTNVPKDEYELVVIDVLSLDEKQRKEMDIDEEEYNLVKNTLEQLSKDKGDMLSIYLIMLIRSDGEEFYGGSPYTLTIKLNDTLKQYDSFALYDLSGIEEEGFSLNNPINVSKNDTDLLVKLDSLNVYLLLGNKKEIPVKPYTIPKTGIE